MNDLLFSLNTTIPVFLVILIGYLFKRYGVFTGEFTDVLNKFVFSFALPLMLFNKMRIMNTVDTIDPLFILICVGITLFVPIIFWIFTSKIIKEKRKIGAIVQGSFRGNVAIIGVALTINIYGNNIEQIILMLSLALPIYNIMSVFVLSSLSMESESLGEQFKGAIKGIIKNPIIWGIIIGVLFSRFSLKMPVFLDSTITSLANIASPIALLGAGAGFKLGSCVTNIKEIILAVSMKLIVFPLLGVIVAYSLGLRGIELFAVLIMTGVPTATTSYIMAKQMDSDYDLASQILAISTILGSISLVFWIYIFREFNLF